MKLSDYGRVSQLLDEWSECRVSLGVEIADRQPLFAAGYDQIPIPEDEAARILERLKTGCLARIVEIKAELAALGVEVDIDDPDQVDDDEDEVSDHG